MRTPEARPYTFFMTDDSIIETWAESPELALEKLGRIRGKDSHLARHSLLREILVCLVPENLTGDNSINDQQTELSNHKGDE